MSSTYLDEVTLDEASFVVLDFETLTPKGRPPEPLELGAMRINPGFRIDPKFRISWLIRPPDGVPITPFDTAQTGIRWEDVHAAPSAARSLAENPHRDRFVSA